MLEMTALGYTAAKKVANKLRTMYIDENWCLDVGVACDSHLGLYVFVQVLYGTEGISISSEYDGVPVKVEHRYKPLDYVSNAQLCS